MDPTTVKAETVREKALEALWGALRNSHGQHPLNSEAAVKAAQAAIESSLEPLLRDLKSANATIDRLKSERRNLKQALREALKPRDDNDDNGNTAEDLPLGEVPPNAQDGS